MKNKLFNRLLLAPVISFVLAACQTTSKAPASQAPVKPPEPVEGRIFACTDAHKYADQVIGDGHCVSFIKHCTDAPNTSAWQPGPRVLASQVPPGAVIATFKNGKYPNKSGYHAAIYIEHDSGGIWVWDQWLGKPVHKRYIRVRNDGAAAGNTAQQYRVVLAR